MTAQLVWALCAVLVLGWIPGAVAKDTATAFMLYLAWLGVVLLVAVFNVVELFIYMATGHIAWPA